MVSMVILWPEAQCLFIWSVFYPSAFANRLLGAVRVECRAAALFHVWVWSFTAPSGEQEPCCYIMTTSWLTGIKPLCLAVWPTPWKVQQHVFGDSHNEALLYLLWSDLMAFPLLDEGNS